MFIEHIGPLVYRSLWSEMLDDRKFYYAISSRAAPAPAGPRFLRMMALRRWQPVGPDALVTMDTRDPFVGLHSPRIELGATSAHGIRQSGLALVKGKRYTGYIYLKGGPAARVSVTLTWGHAARDRAAAQFSGLTHGYERVPFSFTAGADTARGALEITGTGSGSFHIGTVSLMPADNVDGFRPDTIALLRQLHSGFWRFPGGNFTADFNWYEAVGDRDTRPPVLDHAWNAVQSNDVGLDEFMTLCRLLGAAPYITVNAGFGDAHSAAQEVEYMNGSTATPLGALRARNGHPAPYDVKFWNIGNEPYGPWELGHTDLKDFLVKYGEFARAMRRVDPSIVLLAPAAMPDEMTIEGVARDLHIASDEVPYCAAADWTCGYLEHSFGDFNGITEHWYARAGMRFDLARGRQGLRIDHMEPGYVPAKESVLQWVRAPSDRVRLKAEEWRHYEGRFPAMRRGKIFMSIDEYAYTGAPPDLKLSLAYAMVLNEMLRHTNFLRMSAFTMGVSTLDFDATAATLNTTGLLFKLYGKHLGAGLLPVKVTGDSPQPLTRYPLPVETNPHEAGSATYPLDVIAAVSPDRKYLTVDVVNATAAAQLLSLDVRGARIAGRSQLWQMTGPTLESANRLGQKPRVRVRRIATAAAPTLSVPPLSIDIYRFPLTSSPPPGEEGADEGQRP
ncbi:MAG: alpha-N-arabinofuranosidase [Proteobacteria bacterium]|nr:alpha-N-arabinofuranosidase [Pseudomonadota bacterium]